MKRYVHIKDVIIKKILKHLLKASSFERGNLYKK